MGVFHNIEQGEISWLVYTAEQTETVDGYTKGMLQHNAMDGVLAPSIFQRDETLEIKYNITEYESLREFCRNLLTVRDFYKILQSVVDVVQTAEDDYMIDPGNFRFEPEHIFISPETKKTVLVCLPLLNATPGVSFRDFLRDFLIGSRFSEKEDLSYVGKFINLLNSDEDITVEFMKKQLEQLAPGKGQNGKSQASRPAPRPTPVPVMPTVSVASADETASDEKGKKGLFGFGKATDSSGKKEKAGKTGKGSAAVSKKKAGSGPVPSAVAGMTIPGQTPVPTPAPAAGGMVIPGVMPGPQSGPRPEEKKKSGFSLGLGKKEKSGKKEAPSAIPGMAAGGQGAAGSFLSGCFLIRESNGARMMLTKPLLHIGKKRDYADIYIDGNRTISGAHADLVYRDGQYYLRDTNSLNHSYVNGVQVAPGMEQVLQDGDTIRLANENFTYHTGK